MRIAEATTEAGTIEDADVVLTLERTGEFAVRWSVDNTHQCGPSTQTDILTYRAKLTMSGAALDSEGFVVDNMFVQEYFQDTYRQIDTFESCERIAIRTCRDLKVRIGERLLGVEVSISGAPWAILTARCSFASAHASAQGGIQ